MVLSKQTFFILGTTKFDNPYESTTYTLAKYLARDNHVYYIENPYTWKDYFKYKGTGEFNRRKNYLTKASDGMISTEIPNLNVIITPPLLSINFLPENAFYRLVLTINEKIIAKRIKQVISTRKISSYIYINSFNFHYPNVADSLSPLLRVYHCVDPLILPFDRKHGLVSEELLIRKSDLVVCTSKQLYKEKKALHPETYFIPNAADIAHCSKALDESLAIQPDIAKIKKPIIGFFGHTERRINFDLIREVAAGNLDKSFVFVGPISREFVPEWFFDTPNIKIVGRLPYSQLPAVLKGFDVAMIPFKADEVSSTIFPLKLFEYLGAGKPTVITDFNPDLEEFTRGMVRFCSDSESFSNAINEELALDSEERFKQRIAVANENTWTKRVDEFSELMYRAINS